MNQKPNQKSKTGDAEKKTSGKRSAPPRVLPPIVTKDTNDVAAGGAELEPLQTVIDPEVFNDSGDGAGQVIEAYSRSRTIDGTMLPRERFKKAGKKRRKNVTVSVDAAERYEPDVGFGLSDEQVEDRIEEGYVNITRKKTSKTYSNIFITNILTPINLIAAVAAVALIYARSEITQYLFIVIITVNMTIGIILEIRAKLTIEKLSIMSAPTATVIRNGERIVIPVAEVVLDDIMHVEAGKQICADAIVVKGEAELNESLLTGESVPVKKAPGAELYSGSFVAAGNCYARVNKVGASNYVETLTSHVRKYKKPKSELFNSIGLLIKIIIPIALIITALTIVRYYFDYIAVPAGDSYNWTDNIQRAAGVLIGMLPTGMFLLTSTALSVSVVRLKKRHTLVKDLYCIEMLARVDVLCLDKTGTITDGTMSVHDVVEIKGAQEVPYSLSEIIGSVLTATEDNNQTAMALVNKFGYSQALKPTAAVPFSSARKLAAASFGEAGTFMYGAPEFVLRDVGIRIEKLITEYAAKGLRVLVLAHSPAGIIGDKLPSVRRPLCLIAIEDHIREDAFETIRWFRENNVAVRVISGDNPITVSEVARRVGVPDAEKYISLDGLSDRELFEAAHQYTVFGRVTPEQKMLLVKALKQKGHTVAMTGDGVNDILAMRECDCAVAIASGAEAARNVAHLVLQDSSFTSMPQVVKEGRRVINNIQQSSSLFLMKTFMTMLLSIIMVSIGQLYPYKTSYLLLLEFFIIAGASFALALQSNDNLIKGKFLSNVIGRSAPGGITLALATMAIFIFNNSRDILVPSGDALAYESMLILCVTFTGFIVLLKICEPANLFRTVMLVIILGALIFCVLVLPGLFEITAHAISPTSFLFLIVVILGAYFFMSLVIKILRALKILS